MTASFNIALLFASAMPFLTLRTPAQPPNTLAAMRDRYRPLLIVASSDESQKKLSSQIDLLELHHGDLVNRQVLLVPLSGGHVKIRADAATVSLVPGEEAAIRRRFHIHPQDFTVILIGKDGGEKLRSSTPITIQQLNQVIDAMPMRQQEMQSVTRGNKTGVL